MPPVRAIPESEARVLAVNSLLNTARQLIVIAAGVVTAVLLARGLGVEGRGVYGVAMLLPSTLQNLLAPGLQASVTKHVAQAERPQAAVRAALLLGLGGAALSLVAGAVVVFGVRAVLLPGAPLSALLLGLAAAPTWVLAVQVIAVLHGVEDFRASNSVEVLPQTTTTVFTAAALALGTGVLGAVAAFALARLVTVLWGLRMLHARGLWRANTPADRPTRAQIAAMLRLGANAQTAWSARLVNMRADAYLVNGIFGPAIFGLYDVAVQLVERMWMPAMAMASVVLPRVARATPDAAHRATALGTRAVFLITVAGGLALAAIAYPLMRVLYGAAFVPSALALILLVPGVAALAVTYTVGNHNTAWGFQSANTTAMLVGAAANISANLLLIPRLGFYGAALVTSACYIFITVMTVRVYVRRCGGRVGPLLWPQPGDGALLAAGWARVSRGVLRRGPRAESAPPQ